MSKHKLYISHLCSPFNIGLTENKIPRPNENQRDEAKTLCISVQGLKRRNLMAVAVAQKIMKEKHDSPEFEKERHPALLFNSENSKPGTSRRRIFENEELEKKETKKENTDSALASVLKNDSDSEDFYSKFNQKFPYTYQEDETILKFVLKGQNIFRVSSILLWKQLQMKKNNPKRTYQSLKNRFWRNIKPNLFTTYKHLIQDKETIHKILVKFPELKKQTEARNILKIKIPKLEMKPEEDLTLSARSNEFQSNAEQSIESPTTVTNGKFKITDQLNTISPFFQSLKIFNIKRTVTLKKNLIKISVDLNKSSDFEGSFPPSLGLSERFKNLKKNNERVPCPTCGRFYLGPVANDSSESDVESDILIPGSTRTPKNFSKISKNNDFVKNSHATNVRQKKNLISQPSSPNSSLSRKLLITLEKSEESNGDSDESNSIPEKVSIKKMDEIGVSEIVDIPSDSSEKISKENSEDSDSDMDLIFENTVGRYQKLLNSDEDKLPQKRCLQRNRDSISLNTNWEQNLDSFFLDSATERQTPTLTLTNDDPPEVVDVSTQPQKMINSLLASNMIKMLAQQPKKKKHS